MGFGVKVLSYILYWECFKEGDRFDQVALKRREVIQRI